MAINNNQFAISISAEGDNIVVPAKTGMAIQVQRIVLTLESKTTVQFKSGANALSGPISCTSLMFTDESGSPWFITNAGEALIISLGSAISCAGFMLVQYV